MRTDSPLVLDVHEALDHPNKQHHIAFDAALPDLKVGLEQAKDLHFDLTIEAVDGGILARGVISGDATGQCSRCLNPVTDHFEIEGAELYRPPTDVWEEGYVIKDATIDLEPMARDTVGLSLKDSPLCRPDCAGLCSRCGKDLNEGPCDCPAEERIDLRWSQLRELGGLN